MHQKRCVTCCIDGKIQASPENTQILNFYFSDHKAILTIFPTLLSIIWYIYPPTRPVILSVLGNATSKGVDC